MTTEKREHVWERQAAVALESHPLKSRLELDRDDDRSALTVVTFVCNRCGLRGLAVISPQSNTACPDAHVPYFFHSVEQRRTLLDRMLLRMYSANENVVLNVGDRDFRETYPLVSEGFVFTYTDTVQAEAREREFRAWLDRAIAAGLAEWQKQL